MTILSPSIVFVLVVSVALVSSFPTKLRTLNSNHHRLVTGGRIGTQLSVSWQDRFNEVSPAHVDVAQFETFFRTVNSKLWLEKRFPAEWVTFLSQAATNVYHQFHRLPIEGQVAVIVVPIITVLLATLFVISFPPENYRDGMEPYARGGYDPIQAKAYYSRHPLLVWQRMLELLRLSNKFLIALLLDRYVFRAAEERHRPKRAKELLALITKLGPTAIKVGQALSVRPDLIPIEYAEALSTLQDQVPPFAGAKAKDILGQELGAVRFSRLKNIGLTSDPIASASIGQVYRASIDNQLVAVKVQRPNVLADIALDLYIVRELVAPFYQTLSRSGTDLTALANEWGRGFIAELDYRKEAASTINFNIDMQKRGLTAVMAPKVVTEYCTEQILTTEWVDGTRLDQSDAADVPRLCSVALNAYLVMLLETQVLHCDPHPGNLLRTRDGRLCILDWGMTLNIDPNLQYALLEYVAHLTSENYDELPEDLAKLGFLKEEKLDFARRSGVLEPLKYFLRQAGQGGGGKAVRDRIFAEYRAKYPGKTDDELRVEMRAEMKLQMAEILQRESVATGITVEVEELQRQNRDSFNIPEWFLYTSRAFLTLEGVSLQADPTYSIIKSCFPYVAKRLVADDDPRARKALRDLLYGTSSVVDVDRLADLADGFSSYTTTTKTVNQRITKTKTTNSEGEVVVAPVPLNTKTMEHAEKDRKLKLLDAEAALTLAKDSADVLLAPKGNLVQNLLVEEGALATIANFKDSVRDSLVDGPKRFRDSLPFGAGAFLPPLPIEQQIIPFVEKTVEEKRAQELAGKISILAARAYPTTRASNQHQETTKNDSASAAMILIENLRSLDPEQAALVLKELRENIPRYGPLLTTLNRKFLSTLLATASTNIELTLAELERVGKPPDQLTRITAKRLSSVAQQSATALISETARDNGL